MTTCRCHFAWRVRWVSPLVGWYALRPSHTLHLYHVVFSPWRRFTLILLVDRVGVVQVVLFLLYLLAWMALNQPPVDVPNKTFALVYGCDRRSGGTISVVGVHVQRGGTVCIGVEAICCRLWHPVAGVRLGGKHSREPLSRESAARKQLR